MCIFLKAVNYTGNQPSSFPLIVRRKKKLLEGLRVAFPNSSPRIASYRIIKRSNELRLEYSYRVISRVAGVRIEQGTLIYHWVTGLPLRVNCTSRPTPNGTPNKFLLSSIFTPVVLNCWPCSPFFKRKIMERKLRVGLFCRHVGGTNKDREFLRYLYVSFPFLRAHSNVVLRCARPFLNFVATINVDIIRFCSQGNLIFKRGKLRIRI